MCYENAEEQFEENLKCVKLCFKTIFHIFLGQVLLYVLELLELLHY